MLVVAGGEPALAGLLRELGATCGHVGDDLVALLPAGVDLDRLALVVAGIAWGAGAASDDGARGLPRRRRPASSGRCSGGCPSTPRSGSPTPC